MRPQVAAQEIPLLPRATQSPEHLVLGNRAPLDAFDAIAGRESGRRRHRRGTSALTVCCGSLSVLLMMSCLCALGLRMWTSTNSIFLPLGVLTNQLTFPALVGIMICVLGSCLLLPVVLWYAWQKSDQKTQLDPYVHGPLVLGADMGRMPDREGGCYMWVRTHNGFEERALRRRAAQQTLAACRDNGFRVRGHETCDTQHVKLELIHQLTSRTQFVRSSPQLDDDEEAQLCTPSVELVKGRALDVAVQSSRSGARVVVVNAACAYNPGGGFHTGGRHALEESMCVQTTLFASLEHAYRLQPTKFGPPVKPANERVLQRYIPENGVILSPCVEVFRGATSEGYPFWREKVNLAAVVSVALPNCNPEARNTPVDKPSSDAEYEALLLSKFKAVLSATASVNAEVLVMPSVGCGVFKNDPQVVGAAFGEALRSFPCSCNKVLVADQGAFGQSVCCTLDRRLA